MASPDRLEADRLALLARIQEAPEHFDFYQVLRSLEALHPQLPPIGRSKRPASDAVRLGQSPQLSFAPASLSQFERDKAGRPRLSVRFFGLFGPQGPLPLHLTELAHERDLNHDAGLRRFADVFHHRALSFFYRIWREGQPTANRDRPEQDRFLDYLGALIGHAGPRWRRLDHVAPEAKRHFAAHLGRLARTPEGLTAILSEYFGIRVQVQCFQPHWMSLEREAQTRLGGPAETSRLGLGATLGRRVRDAQYGVLIELGPMDLKSYEAMLPGGPALASLEDWIKTYLGAEWFVRARYLLRADEVPAARLGGRGRLGWSTWLGARKSAKPADELQLPLH